MGFRMITYKQLCCRFTKMRSFFNESRVVILKQKINLIRKSLGYVTLSLYKRDIKTMIVSLEMPSCIYITLHFKSL